MLYVNKRRAVIYALLFSLPVLRLSATEPAENVALSQPDADVASHALNDQRVEAASPSLTADKTPSVIERPNISNMSAPTAANETLETSPLPAVKFTLNSEEQKRAYASGVTLARYLQRNLAHQKKLHITLDSNIVLAGIVDAFGHDIKMDDAAIKQTMAVLDEHVAILTKAQIEQEAQRERQLGEAFIAEFAKQDGVKKSKSGLLYLTEKKGAGAAITDKDRVEIELQGRRVNGAVFEQTAKPIILNVNDVIPAVRSGIKLAGNGGKIRLVVPPEQGYGENGVPPRIPPQATLIFDIHVLQVNPK